jgi:hypothetical protein
MHCCRRVDKKERKCNDDVEKFHPFTAYKTAYINSMHSAMGYVINHI